MALPVGPCANGKTATLLLTHFHPCSLGRFRSLTSPGNHAPSGPSLRIGAACGFRSRLNGRSAGEDWKVGLGRGILKRGEWFFSRSSLFRALLVCATRGFSRGANWREELAQVSGRERSIFPSLPPSFSNGARADLAHRVFWSVAAALFLLLAIRILSPPSFFFLRFATPRGRVRQWLRVWERRKSKAEACESCPGNTTFIGFRQGRNPSQVS